jgi:hypothetical protein
MCSTLVRQDMSQRPWPETASFALDQLRLVTLDTGATWMSLGAWRDEMPPHAGMDPDLVGDAFALIGAIRTGPQTAIKDHARLLLDTRGGFGLLAEVFVVLRIANTIQKLQVGTSTDELLHRWALSDEVCRWRGENSSSRRDGRPGRAMTASRDGIDCPPGEVTETRGNTAWGAWRRPPPWESSSTPIHALFKSCQPLRGGLDLTVHASPVVEEVCAVPRRLATHSRRGTPAPRREAHTAQPTTGVGAGVRTSRIETT